VSGRAITLPVCVSAGTESEETRLCSSGGFRDRLLDQADPMRGMSALRLPTASPWSESESPW